MSSLPLPPPPNYLRFEPKQITSANGFNGVKLPPLNFSSIQNNNKPTNPSTMLPFSPSKLSRSIYRVDDNSSSSPPNSPPPLRRGAASPVNCSPVHHHRPIPIRGFREFVTSSSSDASSAESDSTRSNSNSSNPSPTATAADDAKPKKYWDIIAAMAAASTYGFAP